MRHRAPSRNKKTVLPCSKIALTEQVEVLVDHVRIPALNEAVRSEDKLHVVRGVSRMRTESEVHEIRQLEQHHAVGSHSCKRWDSKVMALMR